MIQPLPQSLTSNFAPEMFSQDPGDLDHYGRDWTRTYAPHPRAVAFPRSTADVSKLLKICSELKIPVVPSGGRTGLSGGAVAPNGELVLSLTRMNKIGKIDLLSLTVPVEAGAVTEAVHHAAAEYEMTWPVDFGSKGSSTVGGNISTNAGGINVIKYGMTRHWVLGLTVVLMSGEVLQLNGPLEKNNAGLDLKHLFIGSEGTLGVVTEAILKLTPIETNTRLFFFGVKNHDKVFELLETCRKQKFELHAFEAFSANCFEATTALHKINDPFSAKHAQYVLVEIRNQDCDSWMEQIFGEEIVDEGVEASSQEDAKRFWKTRETISESLSVRGHLHTSDISVAIPDMKAFLQEWEEIFHKKYSAWELFIFGHYGDGNLHIHALKPANMSAEEFLEQNHAVEKDLYSLVGKFNGSVSAEHGVGIIKKADIGYTRKPGEVAILKSLKKMLDPQGLLNPGKVVDL
ncbi:MAG: FAD-binding oxidoreductase [Pseudobdellovibrio sp.]|jgi:FAD/FMN-containing dehydrogenase|nr:FAD-binding oxidoreductase [Pseudobdellovibrio sp.]